MTYSRPKIPPFRSCIICHGNRKRTWSKGYQCADCLKDAPALQRLHARREAGGPLLERSEIPF